MDFTREDKVALQRNISAFLQTVDINLQIIAIMQGSGSVLQAVGAVYMLPASTRTYDQAEEVSIPLAALGFLLSLVALLWRRCIASKGDQLQHQYLKMFHDSELCTSCSCGCINNCCFGSIDFFLGLARLGFFFIVVTEYFITRDDRKEDWLLFVAAFCMLISNFLKIAFQCIFSIYNNMNNSFRRYLLKLDEDLYGGQLINRY